MLLRLLPEQISEQWDIIKPTIEDSLRSACEDADMNEMLTSLLNASSQCWVSSRKATNGGNVIEGIIITIITKNMFGEGKNLLIYSLFGYSMDTREAWRGGAKALALFAKSNQCSRIVAYTDVPSLIKLVENLGGTANQRFVSIPIDALLEIPAKGERR